MYSPDNPTPPTPFEVFAHAVDYFSRLTPDEDITIAFESVRTALLDLIQASPDPNAYTQSLTVLRLAGPIEPSDLEKLQERVRYAYDLLP